MPSQNSLDNLRPRVARYGEAKTRREISVTPTAWAGLQTMAAEHRCSVSELIERLGRGTLLLGDAMGDQPQGNTDASTSAGGTSSRE